MTRTKGMLKSARRATFVTGFAGTVGLLGIVGAGCLSRPVVQQEPATKTSFTAEVRQAAIDKVDLLFAIDNSASMGDKQEILKKAVPDLVDRLLNPICVDENNAANRFDKSNAGVCPAGQQPEFKPVADIHIGIISSALGNRGGDRCPADGPDPTNDPIVPGRNRTANNNDAAHLLNRPGEVDGRDFVADFQPSAFLSWLPPVEENTEKLANRPSDLSPALGDAAKLNASFIEMIGRVREFGCGYEAQLESVYRFLVQPDPYLDVKNNNDLPDGDPKKNVAELQGLDKVLLKQRAQFLRPDSLVAVIMVTDENENNVDPLSIGGNGWAFVHSAWALQGRDAAPRPTSACATNPMDVACTSCAANPRPADPVCDQPFYTPTEDSANVRPIQMKKRFGVDPQYPIERYVQGFRSYKVPNRNVEHVAGSSGKPLPYLVAADGKSYGSPNCTNPLFAKDLPKEINEADDAAISGTLCNLPRGQRTPDLVFFAVIGGVPWQLLVEDPAAGTPVLKEKLTSDDWRKILGNDPLKYDFTGADSHMLESITPRDGLQPTTAGDRADAINGREWTTKGDDLQYACVFDLPKGSERDCTDKRFERACDCTVKNLNDGKNPPLCANNPAPKNPPAGGTPANTLQVRAKAYPTIREFSVVRALGDQGIAASICPITLEDENSELYGYRPALKVIVNRLANALASQCLPEALNPDANNRVPCLILETLPEEGPQSLCDNNPKYPGRKQPDAQVLARFRENQKLQAGDAGAGDIEKFPVCELEQLVVKPGETCQRLTNVGWCYVTNTEQSRPAGKCAQAIQFTPGANLPGSRISLQCIKSTEREVASDAGGGG